MNIKTGDEVRVFSRLRRDAIPDGGYPAAVTKTGRKYAIAVYDGNKAVEFDMETGRERGSVSNSTTLVKTVAQAEMDLRRKLAAQELFRAGISVQYEHRLTLEQMETLAAAVATLPDFDRSSL